MSSSPLPFPPSPRDASAPPPAAAPGASAVAPLPSGTVTFLFSDIEGSTRLLQQLGPRYAALLGKHQRLLRAAWSAHEGHEISTEGDSFFVVFARAGDALAAAAQAQRTLAKTRWPAGVAGVRVRVGLHTGAPTQVMGNYIGLDVHRAARIAAAGHGGQVLLSQTTRELLVGDPSILPAGTTLRDLGEARLKDLRQPEHIFQLVLPDLPADFPPLKSLDRVRHNLPIQPTPFIGRTRDAQLLGELLRRPEVRLLTLTGPGGIGKTRLALQVAANLADTFDDGAYFVALGAISDAELVASAIAQTLGLRQEGSASPAEQLTRYLAGRRMLLVLDNFEQVAGAAPLLARVLAECVGVHFVVTSRVALHLRGEQEYPVAPLTLPTGARQAGDPHAVTQSEAVALFLDRAHAVKPDFTLTATNARAVAEICTRLDGLPLAIELAAARVRSLPPQALLTRLAHRLNLLTGGARDLPERQQTLRNAIAWSYDLLAPEEQTLFRRLAVFEGGCSLDAAEALCATLEGVDPLDLDLLDALDSLVAKSLLRQRSIHAPTDDEQPRFVMLETIAEFGREQLAMSGEGDAAHQAHAAYYRDLAEAAEPHLTGPEVVTWLDQLEREHDNLRSALGWARTRAQMGENDALADGLRLAAAASRFWFLRGHLSEGREALTSLLALAERADALAPTMSGVSPRVWARALHGTGALAFWQSDMASATIWLERALPLAQSAKDQRTAVSILNVLGLVAFSQDEWERATQRLSESLALAREVGDRRGTSAALNNLGELAYHRGEWARAAAAYQEALELVHLIGERAGEQVLLANLGRIAWRQGSLDQAAALLQQALAISQSLGDPRGMAEVLEFLALALQTQPRQSARLLGAASVARALLGTPPPDPEQAEIDEAMAAGPAALGAAAWAAAFADGQALTLAEAVAEALDTATIASE